MRTRPVAPFPRVLPNCQGPTWVFLLAFALPDPVDVVEICESRLLSLASSSATVDSRLLSIALPGALSRTDRLPSNLRDSWCGRRGDEDVGFGTRRRGETGAGGARG